MPFFTEAKKQQRNDVKTEGKSCKQIQRRSKRALIGTHFRLKWFREQLCWLLSQTLQCSCTDSLPPLPAARTHCTASSVPSRSSELNISSITSHRASAAFRALPLLGIPCWLTYSITAGKGKGQKRETSTSNTSLPFFSLLPAVGHKFSLFSTSIKCRFTIQARRSYRLSVQRKLQKDACTHLSLLLLRENVSCFLFPSPAPAWEIHRADWLLQVVLFQRKMLSSHRT